MHECVLSMPNDGSIASDFVFGIVVFGVEHMTMSRFAGIHGLNIMCVRTRTRSHREPRDSIPSDLKRYQSYRMRAKPNIYGLS